MHAVKWVSGIRRKMVMVGEGKKDRELERSETSSQEVISVLTLERSVVCFSV